MCLYKLHYLIDGRGYLCLLTMITNKYVYHVELTAGISKILVPSILVAWVLEGAVLPPVGLLQIPFYMAVLVAIIGLRIQYERFFQRRDTAQRGAVLAPEVKGHWPGNLDILLKYGAILGILP